MGLTRKRVLVTGGAGFFGLHLCEGLLRVGDDVLSVDNCFTGREDNIAHLIGEPHFAAAGHDIAFRSTWRRTRSTIWSGLPRRPITNSTRCRSSRA